MNTDQSRTCGATVHDAAMLAFAEADNAMAHEYAADSLYRHHVTGWSDATTPRTDRPVRFWAPIGKIHAPRATRLSMDGLSHIR